LGSQWRLVVLHDLQDGEKRFNELKRSTGASSRTLSRVLDDLGEMGFVDRRLEEDAPVATYYSLTPKGRSLCPVFEEIEQWADEWLEPDEGNGETDGETATAETADYPTESNGSATGQRREERVTAELERIARELRSGEAAHYGYEVRLDPPHSRGEVTFPDGWLRFDLRYDGGG